MPAATPIDPRTPLSEVGRARLVELDEVSLALYARRMGRPDLAHRLREPVEDADLTLEQRWRQLGGTG
ncbi:hypothetical protein [Agrococcus terreus]|uniref:Uncharacterized protein n=1 Tax=Agrococcus terreus TaxID=574649 RepID=A0ABQ2KEU8_9MICO|nr:hypothetical protein [Agrococcus terreus]GGN79465.1 hypothetical protein GCM10010968_06380 [Agrococcus terreus]